MSAQTSQACQTEIQRPLREAKLVFGWSVYEEESGNEGRGEVRTANMIKPVYLGFSRGRMEARALLLTPSAATKMSHCWLDPSCSQATTPR